MKEINLDSDISDSALAAVGANFNPSGKANVDRIKLIAAAFITECEALVSEGRVTRCASLAITNMEQASMWAVKAATTGR